MGFTKSRQSSINRVGVDVLVSVSLTLIYPVFIFSCVLTINYNGGLEYSAVDSIGVPTSWCLSPCPGPRLDKQGSHSYVAIAYW